MECGKFARCGSNKLTLAVGQRLSRFPGPALLLWGQDDPFFTVELAGRLKDCFAHGRLETIADATVFSPLDQPGAVADGIARFIADRSGARTMASSN